MGAIDNQNWLRSFLSTQLANAQNSMIPVGEAWPQFLNLMNPSVGLANSIMGPAASYLYGSPESQGQLYNLHSQMQNFYGGIPQQFQDMIGGTNQGSNFIQSYLMDSLNAMNPYRDLVGQMFANGMGGAQGQFLTDMTNNFMHGQTPAMSSMLNNGTSLLDNRGNNAWNMNQQDVGSSIQANGGWTPQLNGVAEYLGNFLSGGGSNKNMDAGLGAAMGMIGGQGATPYGNAAMGAGNSLAGFGNQMLGSGGMTPFLQGNMQGIQNIVQNRGAMPQIQGIQSVLFPELMGGSYGQTGTGFQGANQLINSGGQSDITRGVANLAFAQAMGQGPQSNVGNALPDFMSLMGMADQGNSALMNAINGMGGGISGGAGVSAGGVSARALGDGMTPELMAMYNRGMEEINNNPLLSRDQVMGMARDQAGTAFQQQMEAMMARANARGGSPGSTVGSGSQNRALFEFGDQGAQNEAAAVREAMLNQQGLELQRNMKLSDLSNLAQQIAMGRRGQDASLAGQELSANAGLQSAAMGANAQLQAAQMSANANLASQKLQALLGSQNNRNSLLGSLAGTFAGLQGQREQTAAQQQMHGLGALLDAGGQETQRLLGGIGAVPGLQGASNQRQGMNLSAFNDLTSLMSGRELGALGLTPGVAGAQTNNLGLGVNALGQGSDSFLGAGNLANQNMGLGFNALQGLEGLRSNNVLGGLGLMNDAQRSATNNLGVGGQLGQMGDASQQGWAGLGAGMLNNIMGGQLSALGQGIGQNNADIQSRLGVGGLMNDMFGTNLGGLNNWANNNLGMGNLGIQGLGAMGNIMNQGFGNQGNALGAINSGMWNGMGVNTGFANQFMNYLNGSQQGYYGVNPNAGGGLGFLGQLGLTAASAAARAAVGGG